MVASFEMGTPFLPDLGSSHLMNVVGEGDETFTISNKRFVISDRDRFFSSVLTTSPNVKIQFVVVVVFCCLPLLVVFVVLKRDEEVTEELPIPDRRNT